MIETYRTLVNGEYKWLHRCPECTKQLWYATGTPADNNGFQAIDKPIQHVYGCPDRPAEKVSRSTRKKALTV